MSEQEPRALVVVPTYNERDTVAEVIDGVLRSSSADVLVVDDGSPDGTGAIVEARAQSEARLHLLQRDHKRGLGSAYREGFGWGLELDYDLFVEMDGDLSHPPSALPALLSRTDDADLVLGSRYVPGGETRNWPVHRRALSRWGNRYVQLVTSVPVRDATSGYRVYRRAVLEEIDLSTIQSEGYSFQLETVLKTWRFGFHVAEVPITFVERRSGASKISRAIVFEALWRVFAWGLRHRRPAATHPRSIRSSESVR